MLFSESRRFVFVAVPKTGSTAIEKHLQSIDPSIVRNHVLDIHGQWHAMPYHSTVHQIKQVMGSAARDYTFIAFFRDPTDLLRSKYYFYANGRPAQSFNQRKIALHTQETSGIISISTALRVALARLLPITLWAVVYPFRSNSEFIFNRSGKIDVDEIGDFARLNEETIRIFSKFGYSPDTIQLPKVNATEYDRERPLGSLFHWIVTRKLAEDIRVYNIVTASAEKQ